MAASTAPTTGAAPTRGLWQAPVFVLGVGALVAVWLARPLLRHGDAASGLRHELGVARHLLEQPDGDPVAAQKLAEQVLEAKDARPELAGEANLILGGALMRQAAQADEPRAAELWAEARRRLEAAEKEGVPEGDRGRLQYRLGVAGFHTGDNPAAVIARVKTAIDQADDPAEGYTVLTQAYLSGPKPDLQEAQAANYKLRNLPGVKEEVLALARLLGGELELRLGHAEQARKVLTNLGDKATPDMQAKARRLCARSFQEENHWADAAALWQEVLQDGGRPGEALYNLGVCARQQDQNEDAAHHWERCLQAGGDEGQAAAAALAELRLKGPTPEAALEVLAKVVEPVKPGGAWANPLLDRDAVIRLFQQAGKTYMDGRHFDLAVRLADPFERVAAPGEAAVLRGRAAAEWARIRQEEARQAGAAEARKEADDAARDLFRQAAAAYAAAAEQAPATSQPGEYLWFSAHCSWDGRDLEPAAARLEKVLNLEVPEEQKQDWYLQRQGEAWYLLGEARGALKNAEGADAAYSECIKYPTSFAFRARYQLAKSAHHQGRIDDAKLILQQNLDLLSKDPDPEAQEESLFLLSDLLYNGGNYLGVVEKLRPALAPGRYPANPEATRAHYQLADSYHRLADKASATLADPTQSADKAKQKRELYRLYLTNAANEFDDLAKLLDTPEGQNLLTREERVQAPFLAADCKFDLGDYANALAAYEILAKRYANRLEGLNALGGMVRCYSALQENDKMQQSLEEIERVLPKMPDQVRRQWSDWLTVARKPVGPS